MDCPATIVQQVFTAGSLHDCNITLLKACPKKQKASQIQTIIQMQGHCGAHFDHWDTYGRDHWMEEDQGQEGLSWISVSCASWRATPTSICRKSSLGTCGRFYRRSGSCLGILRRCSPSLICWRAADVPADKCQLLVVDDQRYPKHLQSHFSHSDRWISYIIFPLWSKFAVEPPCLTQTGVLTFTFKTNHPSCFSSHKRCCGLVCLPRFLGGSNDDSTPKSSKSIPFSLLNPLVLGIYHVAKSPFL